MSSTEVGTNAGIHRAEIGQPQGNQLNIRFKPGMPNNFNEILKGYWQQYDWCQRCEFLPGLGKTVNFTIYLEPNSVRDEDQLTELRLQIHRDTQKMLSTLEYWTTDRSGFQT